MDQPWGNDHWTCRGGGEGVAMLDKKYVAEFYRKITRHERYKKKNWHGSFQRELF